MKRTVKDAYILKHVQPTKQLDEEMNPSNVMKPGHTGVAITERQTSWRKRLGLQFNVLAAFESPKTTNWLMEDMIHDLFGPWRIRCVDDGGQCSRETASDVPLGVQALAICFGANATAQEVDPEDFTKFSPTQKTLQWVVQKIKKFNQLVSTEGFTRLNYGRSLGQGVFIDGPYNIKQDGRVWYNNHSELAHELVLKFNPDNMPKQMEMCKYKKTKFLVGA
jgi:hypothetical protein